MLARLESEYVGLRLNMTVSEVRNTFCIALYGGPIGYSTRYLFGSEDVEDLESDVPELKEWKAFVKQAKGWADKLITNAKSSTYPAVEMVSELFNRRLDTFMVDCPCCPTYRRGEKAIRIQPDEDRCYHCEIESQIQTGKRCPTCRKEYSTQEDGIPRSWECEGHAEEIPESLADLLNDPNEDRFMNTEA